MIVKFSLLNANNPQRQAFWKRYVSKIKLIVGFTGDKGGWFAHKSYGFDFHFPSILTLKFIID